MSLHTPYHDLPIIVPLGKRKRSSSPGHDPTRISKKRKLSLHDPSLRGSSRALRRAHIELPTEQVPTIKFRPQSLFFNAILSDGKGILVLLITLKAGLRILKLYPSLSNDRLAYEHDAYTALENTHHSGSVAPRCYGYVDRIDVDYLVNAFHNLTSRQMVNLRSTHFGRACPKGTRGRALLIQHIPGASALKSIVTDDIIRKAERGLEELHRRGVVHGDPAPRNLMITEDNDIVWIDYDLAITTKCYEIEDGRFFDDFTRMRREFG